MVHVQTEIRSLEDIARDIYRLRLFAPAIVEQGVLPGQFVHIRLPGDTQRLLRRPISIMAARPDEGEIDLVIQAVGEGTRLLRNTQSGDTLDVLGPLGRAFDEGQARRIYFVGGGVGVAPVRCAMDAFVSNASNFSNAPNRQATAFFGFRSAAYAYGLEDAPCEVRVSTDDGSMGAHAFVTDLLKAAIEEGTPDLIIACGPTPMLHTVQNMALRERIPCQLSLEEHMACGIGACLVCNCKMRVRDGTIYKRVCVDGPVFDAREVCFDG